MRVLMASLVHMTTTQHQYRQQSTANNSNHHYPYMRARTRRERCECQDVPAGWDAIMLHSTNQVLARHDIQRTAAAKRRTTTSATTRAHIAHGAKLPGVHGIGPVTFCIGGNCRL